MKHLDKTSNKAGLLSTSIVNQGQPSPGPSRESHGGECTAAGVPWQSSHQTEHQTEDSSQYSAAHATGPSGCCGGAEKTISSHRKVGSNSKLFHWKATDGLAQNKRSLLFTIFVRLRWRSLSLNSVQPGKVDVLSQGHRETRN